MSVELVTKGPDWAYGCEYCDYGVLTEPEALVVAYTSLYLRRAAGWKLGVTEFCQCRAGHLARQRARNDWTRHGNEFVEAAARKWMTTNQPAQTMHKEK